MYQRNRRADNRYHLLSSNYQCQLEKERKTEDHYIIASSKFKCKLAFFNVIWWSDNARL